MIKNMDIICTVGPSSMKKEVLERLQDRGTDFFRINLSHTPLEEVEEKIKIFKSLNLNVPLMLDTEGCQIRTGNKEILNFIEGSTVRVWGKDFQCDQNNISVKPFNSLEKFHEGDFLHMDFNSSLIKITSTKNKNEGFVEGGVLIGGEIGVSKGVHLESNFRLPTYSEKDLLAIELGKKYGIKDFTLSFIYNKEDLIQFKNLFPEANFIAKIETKEALQNLSELLEFSKSILIDRGDLGRVVPLEKMPFIVKEIIKIARDKGVKVFVAGNTIEKMFESLKPNQAEANDLASLLDQGVSGIVLTKETAVGKYPVETLNLVSNIFKEYSCKNGRINFTDLLSKSLVQPHGGKLINKTIKNPKENGNLKFMKKISVSEEVLMDIEQISTGAYSPLEGFMDKENFLSVLENYHLKNGVFWPLPIYLQLKEKNELKEGEEILLVDENENNPYARLEISEIFELDKKKVVKDLFGTENLSHPGVKKFMEGGDFFVGGEIFQIKKRVSKEGRHSLTPEQSRRLFYEKGWKKVVGFHTRNVIHKAHEFIQLESLRRSLADGLFVHPVIGKKKKGDFEAHCIIDTYEKMIKDIYPKKNVIFSPLATYSRYAGPREALFTALIRKNFGCSHFIVGRDHTGVGKFYSSTASQEIFKKFGKDLGINPIFFGEVGYSKKKDSYVLKETESETKSISGTEVREMFKRGESPPEWFMRPEISEIILNKINKGINVFVE